MTEQIHEEIREINKQAQGLRNRITFAKTSVAKFTRLHDACTVDAKKESYKTKLNEWIAHHEAAKKAFADFKPEFNALFTDLKPVDNVKKISAKERKLGRSEDYYQLSPEDQWEEDSRLGLLDWDGYDMPTRKMKKKQTIEE